MDITEIPTIGTPSNFSEVVVSPTGIKTHISDDSKDMILFLKEQGIEYDFEIEFCG